MDFQEASNEERIFLVKEHPERKEEFLLFLLTEAYQDDWTEFQQSCGLWLNDLLLPLPESQIFSLKFTNRWTGKRGKNVSVEDNWDLKIECLERALSLGNKDLCELIWPRLNEGKDDLNPKAFPVDLRRVKILQELGFEWGSSQWEREWIDEALNNSYFAAAEELCRIFPHIDPLFGRKYNEFEIWWLKKIHR